MERVMKMIKSSLAQAIYPAYQGNYTVGRSGRKIEAITIHHMAGRLSAKQCGSIFQTVGRCGSSHYGVGVGGEIACYVGEENTAWTNSNWDSNCKSVTIETSDNDSTWYVNDTTLNSLIKLVADIARRNSLGILVKGKNITWHSMFASTDCPGWYLLEKMDYIIAEANKINMGTSSSKPNYTGVITYQAYTNKWLPAVRKCDNTANGFDGIDNEPITAFRCKPAYGEIIYEAHKLGGGWYGAVNSRDYSSNSINSYAGIPSQAIDLIRIKSTKGYVDYRVKTREDGWLPWVRGFGDRYYEYAGIVGHAIIGIQMK